jgi:TonB-dependent SusC/RagA subfamily outer membrane receptor
VSTNDSQAPFSFFNWLFWNQEIELKSNKGEQVFRHELFHIHQKHSLDIVFLEVVSMVFWINPFFHLIKKETRAIHEFLADQYALDNGEKWNYAETLLMYALQTKHSLVNPFFHNQIKRRIAMITNPQKTSHQYLRKLLVLPVAAVVVTLFAFSYHKDKPVLVKSLDPITIIIDAGHGGIDPGAKSPDDRILESKLALELAKTVKQLAPEYNINVVMTREDDRLPGGATTKEDGLRNRVEISNKVKPRIFISLHINHAGSNGFQQDHSGIEAYVTNKRPDDPGKAAASVLLQEMSTVYKTAPDLKFRKETNIFVLDKNTCPTVLLQCGYINNRMDLEFMTKNENQEKLARAILRGVVAYNKGMAIRTVSPVEDTDSIPGKYNIVSLDIKLAEGYSIKGENINMHMPEAGPGKDSKYELIVFNGQLLTLEQAKKELNGIVIKTADVSIIPANDRDAIAKYGDRAKSGVMVIKDAVIEKKITRSYVKVTVPNRGSSENIMDDKLVLGGEKADPLIIVDGEELPPTPEGKESMRRLDYIDPNTIETIDVLKGESAMAIYGEKGKNGVILIKTKKKAGIRNDTGQKDSAALIVTGYGQKSLKDDNTQ